MMETCADRSSPREQGFTLTELLVAMVLAGIVMASLYSAYMTQQRAYQTTQNVTVVQQNLRSAMYFLEKDLRMAGYDPKESRKFGFTNITSYNQNSVSFTLDTKETGKVDPGDSIAYDFHPTNKTLRRKVGSGATAYFQPIASEISDVSFTFFSATGVTTIIPTDIRSVAITIQGSRGGHDRDLYSKVVCRNMGL